MKKFITLVSALLLTFALSACSAENQNEEANADAPLGYRYWGYSQSSADGQTWTTAMEGPATTNPADGSVEGWNYTLSAEGVVDPEAPTLVPNFQELCSGTSAQAGKKRIGYVIEFGNSEIHPEGDTAPEATSGCAKLPVDATGLDVLKAVSEVRAGEGGFICGLNGFPSKDCGADPIPVPASMRK